MATIRTSKKGSNLTLFLKENWVLILGAIFILPYVINYLSNWVKQFQDKRAENLAENPIKLKNELDAVADGFYLRHEASFIQSQAKIVYESFNIPESWYSWLNPGNWFEDDEAAYKAILAVTSGATGDDFEYMQTCYTMISGGKRDMYTDCAKYMDKKYFNLITGW